MHQKYNKPTLLMIGVSPGLIDISEYNSVITNSGVEGFQQLLESPDLFSAIIIGPNLKDIQPLFLIHKINCASNLKTIPILMEAHSGTREELEQSVQHGVRYYIDKKSGLAKDIIESAIRDRDRYKNIEQRAERLPTTSTLVDATFKLQTLQEAQAASSIMAQACPNPRLSAVAITELLFNAIEHGNLGIGYQEKTLLYKKRQWIQEIERRLLLPENREKYVTVHFNKSIDTITIRISDQGEGFNWEKYQDLGINRVYESHGRGILMAKNLAFQSVTYNNYGNEVECVIRLV